MDVTLMLCFSIYSFLWKRVEMPAMIAPAKKKTFYPNSSVLDDYSIFLAKRLLQHKIA